MTVPEIIVQGIGFVAVAAFILSYQIKSKELTCKQLTHSSREQTLYGSSYAARLR